AKIVRGKGFPHEWVRERILAPATFRTSASHFFYRFAEFFERFTLELADALAGQADLRADLLERERLQIVQPVAQPQDGGFAVVDLFEQLADHLGIGMAERGMLGSRRFCICKNFREA